MQDERDRALTGSYMARLGARDTARSRNAADSMKVQLETLERAAYRPCDGRGKWLLSTSKGLCRRLGK